MLNQTTPKTENMIKATVSIGLCCPNTVGTYYKTYSFKLPNTNSVLQFQLRSQSFIHRMTFVQKITHFLLFNMIKFI